MPVNLSASMTSTAMDEVVRLKMLLERRDAHIRSLTERVHNLESSLLEESQVRDRETASPEKVVEEMEAGLDAKIQEAFERTQQEFLHERRRERDESQNLTLMRMAEKQHAIATTRRLRKKLVGMRRTLRVSEESCMLMHDPMENPDFAAAKYWEHEAVNWRVKFHTLDKIKSGGASTTVVTPYDGDAVLQLTRLGIPFQEPLDTATSEDEPVRRLEESSSYGHILRTTRAAIYRKLAELKQVQGTGLKEVITAVNGKPLSLVKAEVARSARQSLQQTSGIALEVVRVWQNFIRRMTSEEQAHQKKMYDMFVKPKKDVECQVDNPDPVTQKVIADLSAELRIVRDTLHVAEVANKHKDAELEKVRSEMAATQRRLQHTSSTLERVHSIFGNTVRLLHKEMNFCDDDMMSKLSKLEHRRDDDGSPHSSSLASPYSSPKSKKAATRVINEASVVWESIASHDSAIAAALTSHLLRPKNTVLETQARGRARSISGGATSGPAHGLHHGATSSFKSPTNKPAPATIAVSVSNKGSSMFPTPGTVPARKVVGKSRLGQDVIAGRQRTSSSGPSSGPPQIKALPRKAERVLGADHDELAATNRSSVLSVTVSSTGDVSPPHTLSPTARSVAVLPSLEKREERTTSPLSPHRLTVTGHSSTVMSHDVEDSAWADVPTPVNISMPGVAHDHNDEAHDETHAEGQSLPLEGTDGSPRSILRPKSAPPTKRGGQHAVHVSPFPTYVEPDERPHIALEPNPDISMRVTRVGGAHVTPPPRSDPGAHEAITAALGYNGTRPFAVGTPHPDAMQVFGQLGGIVAQGTPIKTVGRKRS